MPNLPFMHDHLDLMAFELIVPVFAASPPLEGDRLDAALMLQFERMRRYLGMTPTERCAFFDAQE